MEISTRQATTNDTEIISEIGTLSFIETYAAFNTQEDMNRYLLENFQPEIITKDIDEDLNIYHLAFADGEPAGYIKLIKFKRPEIELPDENVIEISRIYSLKKFIGKGIGRALMLAAIDSAMQLDCGAIWLGVWQQNHTAIEFYKKWDFEIFGTHTFVLGDDEQDDWLMKKEL